MDKTMEGSRPFSRLTEGRATSSWRAAIPVIVAVAVVLALLTYLVSSLSSSSQRATTAERDAQQAKEQLAGLTKQMGGMQKDLALARSPGRTTVVLEPAEKKEGAAWAAASWGDLPDGTTFVRVNAYGLLANRELGKAFHVWFQPGTGDPVDVGAVEVDANGSGFLMLPGLSGLDLGKQLMLTADAAGSKQPGDVLARADLPGAKAEGEAAPPAEQPKAKRGDTSKRMHREPGK